MTTETQWDSSSIDTLLRDFLSHDNLKKLAYDTGKITGCPLLILDDTFHVVSYYMPSDFTDPVFQGAVQQGEITYAAGAIISRSPELCVGKPDFIELNGSAYRRRFAPLESNGIRLGYLVCVDVEKRLEKVPDAGWHMLEQILAKQLYVEASHQDKPVGTAEEILIHLLNGKFPSESYFRLQISNTFLESFQPTAFALMDFTGYHSAHFEKNYLKEKIDEYFPEAHPFLYRRQVILFLHDDSDRRMLQKLAENFSLKIIISDAIDNLYYLPEQYLTAYKALKIWMDYPIQNELFCICTVAQLRFILMLQEVAGHAELIMPELRNLAAYDEKKNTQYCETLYWYLTYGHSLKKTCDMLFTHRNTVCYRIRKLQEEFSIPVENPKRYAELLFGVSMILFHMKGPEFFLAESFGKNAACNPTIEK